MSGVRNQGPGATGATGGPLTNGANPAASTPSSSAQNRGGGGGKPSGNTGPSPRSVGEITIQQYSGAEKELIGLSMQAHHLRASVRNAFGLLAPSDSTSSEESGGGYSTNTRAPAYAAPPTPSVGSSAPMTETAARSMVSKIIGGSDVVQRKEGAMLESLSMQMEYAATRLKFMHHTANRMPSFIAGSTGVPVPPGKGPFTGINPFFVQENGAKLSTLIDQSTGTFNVAVGLQDGHSVAAPADSHVLAQHLHAAEAAIWTSKAAERVTRARDELQTAVAGAFPIHPDTDLGTAPPFKRRRLLRAAIMSPEPSPLMAGSGVGSSAGFGMDLKAPEVAAALSGSKYEDAVSVFAIGSDSLTFLVRSVMKVHVSVSPGSRSVIVAALSDAVGPLSLFKALSGILTAALHNFRQHTSAGGKIQAYTSFHALLASYAGLWSVPCRACSQVLILDAPSGSWNPPLIRTWTRKVPYHTTCCSDMTL